MVFTDPIADFLTRIRNAQTAKHDTVSVPFSVLKKSLADILLAEGYINNVEVADIDGHKNINIVLRYGKRYEKVITNLRRISKPGLRVYCGYEDIPKVLDGLGIAILSTSKGVMTDKSARANKVGGEVLCYIW